MVNFYNFDKNRSNMFLSILRPNWVHEPVCLYYLSYLTFVFLSQYINQPLKDLMFLNSLLGIPPFNPYFGPLDVYRSSPYLFVFPRIRQVRNPQLNIIGTFSRGSMIIFWTKPLNWDIIHQIRY